MNLLRLFDLAKLGAALLASGPALMQLGGRKETWWLGLGFTVMGPLLMAIRSRK